MFLLPDTDSWFALGPVASVVRGHEVIIESRLTKNEFLGTVETMNGAIVDNRKLMIDSRDGRFAITSLGGQGKNYSFGWTLVGDVRHQGEVATTIVMREAVPLAAPIISAGLGGLCLLVWSLIALRWLAGGFAIADLRSMVFGSNACMFGLLVIVAQWWRFIGGSAFSPLDTVLSRCQAHVVSRKALQDS